MKIGDEFFIVVSCDCDSEFGYKEPQGFTTLEKAEREVMKQFKEVCQEYGFDWEKVESPKLRDYYYHCVLGKETITWKIIRTKLR